MAASLAGGHSLPRRVLEFPSKSGLGSGCAGGTEHAGGAWKRRKSFAATHLVVGWVRGLLLVVRKARGWLHRLCVLCRMQAVSGNQFCPFDFCPVSYFQKGVTVFSGMSIVKFFIFFFYSGQIFSWWFINEAFFRIVAKSSPLKKKYILCNRESKSISVSKWWRNNRQS